MKNLTGRIKPAITTDLPVAPLIIEAPAKPVAQPLLVNLLPSIKKEKDGSPLVSYDQSAALTSLTFTTGEVILGPTDRYFIYEIVNMLNTIDYELVYNFLSVDWVKVFGNVPDIRKLILFKNPLLKSAKEKLDLDMEIFRDKIDVETGAVDCKRCGSSNTISVEKQTRSADEQTTVFVTCQHCKLKWRAQ